MNKKEIKILYFGTPKISADVLEKLLSEDFNIIGLVAQEDKPIGRKQIITNVPTKAIAKKYGIPVFQPHRIKNDYLFIRDLNPDLILTMAYGQIVPKEVLDTPKFGCLNLHGSLLPKYRGASPIQTALLNGDSETGVTLMQMVEKMDAGRIYTQKSFKICDSDNYDSLQIKISQCAYELFNDSIQEIIDGNNKGIEQNENEVTFTKKILSSDGEISFSDTSKNIFNKIRAFTSNPGAYFVYKNEKIKVSEAKIIDLKAGKRREILDFSKDGLKIGTSNYVICITKLQRPGKKMLNISDFYNGNKNFFEIGDII